MRIALVIITINRRPKRNYIESTFNSLQEHGVIGTPGVSIDVFDSGSDDMSYLRFLDKVPVTVHTSDVRLSLNANRTRALGYAGKLGADYVLFMEDDILVAPQFIDKVKRFIAKYQNTRVWNFFAAYGMVAERARTGHEFWDMPVGAFYGTQCFATRSVDALSMSEYMYEHLVKRKLFKGGDLYVGKWTAAQKEYNRIIKCHAPSLVQHVGRQSSINNQWFNNSSYDMNFNAETKNDPWMLTEKTFEWIRKYVKKKIIIEFGSGKGSLKLAQMGYIVYTIEHNKKWMHKFNHKNLRYIYAELIHEGKYRWYNHHVLKRHFDKIDWSNVGLIVVDGPPGSVGRRGAFEFRNLWTDRCKAPVLFDDTNRNEERNLAVRYAKITGRKIKFFEQDAKHFGVVWG